jgi:hypothetical protein
MLPTESQLIDYFIFDAEDVDVGTFSRAKTDEVAAHFKIDEKAAYRALNALAKKGLLNKTRDIMKRHKGEHAVGYQWWEYGWKPGDRERYESKTTTQESSMPRKTTETIEVIPEHGGWVVIRTLGTGINAVRWTLSGTGGWHWSNYPNPPWGNGKFQTEKEARAWLDTNTLPETLRSAKEAPFKTRREPDDPREIGAVYAVDQIESPYFQDWVHEQMVEAEQMRQADPSSVMPLETQADARKVARNMLKQLEWDTKRELSESKEFYEGFDEVLQEPFTVQWLADILLEMTQEEIVPSGRETREARGPHSVQVGDRVRAHWTHGGNSYSATGTIEKVLKHDVKVKIDEDAGDHFRRGFVVTVPIEKSPYNRIEIVGGRETREARPHAEAMTAEQREAIVAALRHYGADLSADGFITKGEKVLSVRPEVKKGRMRMISTNGDVLATYPVSRLASGVADFVERFWYWKPETTEPAGRETREAHAEGWIIASNDKHELSVDMSDFYEETHPLFSSKSEADKAIKDCFPGNEDQFKAKRSARFIPAGRESR